MNRLERHSLAIGLALLLAAMSGAWGRTDRQAAISADALVGHIAVLTSEEFGGRRTGERGNVEAARYIAAEFARAGLKRAGTARQLDATARTDGSGYYQPFSYPSALTPGKDNALSATVGGRAKKYRLHADFEPVRFSGSGRAAGEIVFVGFGVSSTEPARDEYAGVDVTGKIVLLFEGTPDDNPSGPFAAASLLRRKVAAAKERGALAVLAIRAADGRTPQFADTAPSQIPVLSVSRAIAATWLRASGETLADVQKASGAKPEPRATGVTATVHASMQQVYTTSANIVGLVPGSDPALKEQVVVIGGHMDHLGFGGQGSLSTDRKPAMHPGADDNASGASGVIGLAHYFAESTTRPKRSLLFICFSGEEEGLLGSAAYTRSPIVPLDRTAAMLNMDMIGRMADDKLIVMGTGTSPMWSGLLDDLNKAAAFRLTQSPGAYGGSDHQSFFVKGVPVLFFLTGIHPDYHKPSDTLDKINGLDEERVVEFVAAIADRIANTPARPAFQQPPAAQGGEAAPRPRARVSLGTIPEYGSAVAGVQLAGVRAGSPADKAGLRAGDIIVKLAGRDIGSLQDFMDALNDRKPGDVVDIVVKRGSELKTLAATLQASVAR